MTKLMLLVFVGLLATILSDFNQAVPIEKSQNLLILPTSAIKITSTTTESELPLSPPPPPPPSPSHQPPSGSQTLQIAEKPCVNVIVNCGGGMSCNQPILPGQQPCYPVPGLPQPPLIKVVKINIRDIIEAKISIFKRFVCTIVKTLFAWCTGGSGGGGGPDGPKPDIHIKNDIETHSAETSYNEIETSARIRKRSPQQPYDINIEPMRIHHPENIVYKPEQYCYVDLNVIENGSSIMKRIVCPTRVIQLLRLYRY